MREHPPQQNTYEAALEALKLQNRLQESGNRNARKKASEAYGIGEGTLSRLTQFLNLKERAITDGNTPLIAKAENYEKGLSNGAISISEALRRLRYDEKMIRRERELAKQRESICRIDRPVGTYDIIVIDPPWPYGDRYNPDGHRSASPYPEMPIDEIKSIDLPASDDSVLFLWTTHQFIWDAREILAGWGFKYHSMIVWDKEVMGLGSLFRMQCEFCLVGTKGDISLIRQKDANSFRDLIRETRREHSRKPDSFYNMVDSMFSGRKLDYFSREKRNGWDSYGNDTKRFTE